MERQKNPSNLSEINLDTRILCSIVTGVWIIVSKNKQQWCHASFNLLHNRCLVLHNVLSPPVAWRDET